MTRNQEYFLVIFEGYVLVEARGSQADQKGNDDKSLMHIAVASKAL